MSSVIFDNVSKSFLKGTGVSTSLIEALYKGSRNLISRLNGLNDKASDKLFWALKDVSFEVKPGEAFAIVGPNGAGKSTALKLLSRVSWPTKGDIYTNGRLACLIELGAGFHPELTGRENIFLYGTIMGMTKDEIISRFDSIMEFAEFKEFLDTPVKRYSSGMYARLGFSVAIHTSPDILLVDEVLAVGDWAFQQKCFKEMEELRLRGCTLIVVSHNMNMLARLCSRGIVLYNGSIYESGNIDEIVDAYYSCMKDSKLTSESNDGNKVLNKKARIHNINLKCQNGEETNVFYPGDKVWLSFKVDFFDDVEYPEFGFAIKRSDLLINVYATGARELGCICKIARKGDKYLINFPFEVNLLRGVYHLSVEVRDGNFKEYYDFDNRAKTITVSENISHGGIANLNAKCIITKV